MNSKRAKAWTSRQPTVSTSWGVPVLDDLWQAIDHALWSGGPRVPTPSMHVARDDLRRAMRAAVEAWREMEADDV